MVSPSWLVQGTRFICLVSVLALIVSLFAGWLAPTVTAGPPAKTPRNMALLSALQICRAVRSMANDNPALGWPGDMKAKGQIVTLSDFGNVLVRSGCLKPGDLKIFSGPGYKVYHGSLTSGSDGVLSPPFTDEYCAYKIYLVTEQDPSNTIILASKNFTYNMGMASSKTEPWDKYFFIMRKGEGGLGLKKQQAQNFRFIGKLPGGGIVESSENCLNPSVLPQK